MVEGTHGSSEPIPTTSSQHCQPYCQGKTFLSSPFLPRKAVPSSYLLSTTEVCTLDAAADHKQKPVEQPLDPQ
eukprot:723473-Pelagomonas_calceolata.AAC.2